MKKILKIALFILITSCSGSEIYRGNWKAIDVDGEKCLITFEENQLRIIDEQSNQKIFGYTQNSINTVNGIATYGIVLEDEREYYIIFLNPDDKSNALILNVSETVIYTMGRNEYVTYEQIKSL